MPLRSFISKDGAVFLKIHSIQDLVRRFVISTGLVEKCLGHKPGHPY
jgi:hypothetical protein